MLRELQKVSTPLQVGLADASIIESTHEGYLPIDGLPKEATAAHLFPALGQTSLLSIGQLCDHGCEAHFTATTVTVTYKDSIILQGQRNPSTNGLWIIDIQTPQQALAAVNFSASPAELVAFAHAALFSPTISTLSKALSKGYLPPFPGLTIKTLQKYTPPLTATVKGHLTNKRKNTQQHPRHHCRR